MFPPFIEKGLPDPDRPDCSFRLTPNSDWLSDNVSEWVDPWDKYVSQKQAFLSLDSVPWQDNFKLWKALKEVVVLKKSKGAKKKELLSVGDSQPACAFDL